MSAARPLLALGVCAALVVAPGVAGAKAKPKPVCNLITDAADDGAVDNGVLEIVSGDIATKSKVLTTVVRVANADLSKGTIPTGSKIQFTFSADGQDLFTGVTYDPVNGLDGYWGHQGDTGGEIEGAATPVIDAAKKEIRLSIPTSAFSTANIKPGTVFSSLGANADVIIATPKAALQGNIRPFSNDTAMGSGTYKADAPSCVKVGK